MVTKFVIGLSAFAFAVAAQEQPIVIQAGTLIDGKGGVQRNVSISVVGSKIDKIGGSAKAASSDLRKMTVIPGIIDTHVHIGWHFGPDGRYQPRDASQVDALGYAMENGYVTLMAASPRYRASEPH